MDKLRFYDFMSFVLPGAFVVLFVAFVVGWLVPIIPLSKLDAKVTESLVFLVLVLIVGHVVQTYGNEFESREVHYWGWDLQKMAKNGVEETSAPQLSPWVKAVMVFPFLRDMPRIQRWLDRVCSSRVPLGVGNWYSQTLLGLQNQRYPVETKRALLKAAQNVFPGLLPIFEEEDGHLKPTDSGRTNQTVFDLAYRLILQKNAAPHTEEFNAQYGFYRGMCVAIGSITWLALATAFFLLAAAITCQLMSFHFAWKAALIRAAVALTFALVGSIVFRAYQKRYERFAFYFANSVFMNFLVFCTTRLDK